MKIFNKKIKNETFKINFDFFLGPEPSFQAPHQHQPIEQPQEPDEDEADEGPPNETPEQR